jgi:hypothetical protein
MASIQFAELIELADARRRMRRGLSETSGGDACSVAIVRGPSRMASIQFAELLGLDRELPCQMLVFF